MACPHHGHVFVHLFFTKNVYGRDKGQCTDMNDTLHKKNHAEKGRKPHTMSNAHDLEASCWWPQVEVEE